MFTMVSSSRIWKVTMLMGSRSHRRSASRKSSSVSVAEDTPTPDGRHFIVQDRLWRLSNPFLDAPTRERLVRDLMKARRAIKTSALREARSAARRDVDAAKRASGERGNVCWCDDAPDYNRKLAFNTRYASRLTQGYGDECGRKAAVDAAARPDRAGLSI